MDFGAFAGSFFIFPLLFLTFMLFFHVDVLFCREITIFAPKMLLTLPKLVRRFSNMANDILVNIIKMAVTILDGSFGEILLDRFEVPRVGAWSALMLMNQPEGVV